jgi:hypothetical protein
MIRWREFPVASGRGTDAPTPGHPIMIPTDHVSRDDSSNRKLRLWLLVFMHLTAACMGLSAALSPEQKPRDLLMGMALAVTVVLACVADGRIVGARIARINQFIMLFTWPVAAPIYLLWTRKWKGLLWSALWLVTLVLASWIPMIAIIIIGGPA